MNTTKFLFFLSCLALLISPLFSKETKLKPVWLNDYEKALSYSKKYKRPILVDFTGSDWCGWCIKLKKEVFNTKIFKKYASKNLILLELDFPKRKKISKKLKMQNSKLAEKFNIRGYPTILLLDQDGNELHRTGYKRGGAKNYIKHLHSLLNENKG